MDKGRLTINGKTVSTRWDLELSKDYIDLSVFGDPNKSYVRGETSVDITYDEPATDFNVEAAREMYDEDPVALAIIDRLDKMEREVAFLREERDSARGHILSLQKQVLESQKYQPQFKATDPVKNRKKPKNARKTGR